MKRITIAIVLSFITFFAVAFVAQSFSCPAVSCLVFPGKEAWKLIETYEDTRQSWRGLFIHPDYRIRLEKITNVSPTKAAEFTKIRMMKLQGLFEHARSPYPGVLSQEIKCTKPYIPEEKQVTTSTGVAVTYFIGYLNDRLQYGTCMDNQITAKGYGALFYCETHRAWYELEIIVPIDNGAMDNDSIKLISGIGCR